MGEGVRRWRKSSKSGCGCANCVEVATSDGNTIVRDSKDADGEQLAFSLDRWREFVEGVKAGEFDRRAGSEPS
jgi:hypothetical protein